MEKSTLKGKAKVLALGGCAAAIAVGGTLAYLTATDSATNEFQVAPELAGKITVVEDNWDPDAAKDIVPTQSIAKDPKLKNDSTIDVYAIMQVSVPYGKVATADEKGNVQAAADTELFAYQVNPDWQEIGTAQVSDDGSSKLHTYLYTKTLGAGNETSTVFDSVTLINAVDGQLKGSNLTIDVDGFAIQKEGFETGQEAWQAYQNQNQDQNQTEG